MADVFISYHEQSAGELAEQIANALEDAGISCWCARRDMLFGGNFAREIPSQIHACRLFLLILNENVYHSEHIENEVGIAFSRLNKKEDIRILPLEIGEFTRKDWVEYYLIHAQSVKFPAQPDEQRIQRLAKHIAKALKRESQLMPQTIASAPLTVPPQAKSESELILPSKKIIKHGGCGFGVGYFLYANGILIIYGRGTMGDFYWDFQTKSRNTPWWEERKMISSVEIRYGITTIGRAAFNDCVQLTSVSIPESVTTIRYKAFNGCVNLTDVNIPNGVAVIQETAFEYCDKLTNVSVPAQTEIALHAFPGHVQVTRRV